MSSFEIEGKTFDEKEFSSISTWHPPGKFPGFYKLCRDCSKPFYTRFNYTYCPDCLDSIERGIIARHKLQRARLSNDL